MGLHLDCPLTDEIWRWLLIGDDDVDDFLQRREDVDSHDWLGYVFFFHRQDTERLIESGWSTASRR